MNYFKCYSCNSQIYDKKNALVVIERNVKGQYIAGYTVHKQECDNKLEAQIHQRGMNSNSSMELSAFNTDLELVKYLETGEL
ncbi:MULTISPECIES: hypothetical protein [unclassified Exiguobacterium]|uniref:hypothetical protein n=1 Tax=unclassified Exiguobacterium TaxID=2644629 RepID=UPI001BE5325B|nr:MULTISPECIES: hypothetical protein [unclassified Exiguobacterium]